jgi:hypothetical protein
VKGGGDGGWGCTSGNICVQKNSRTLLRGNPMSSAVKMTGWYLRHPAGLCRGAFECSGSISLLFFPLEIMADEHPPP